MTSNNQKIKLTMGGFEGVEEEQGTCPKSLKLFCEAFGENKRNKRGDG